MKKTYKELPKNYPVCGHEDCPMADSCLHRQAFIKLIETENFLRLINPRHCNTNASCKYYRSNTPVLFARGFVNFQQKMFPELIYWDPLFFSRHNELICIFAKKIQ